MNRKLKIERRDEGSGTFLALSGIIDENSDFKDAFLNLPENVVIDLEGIDLINSCGVREWVNAVQKWPPHSRIRIVKCSPRIVEQINYVTHFLGRGSIESFYAPYFCPKCKKESNILLAVEDMRKSGSRQAPPGKCPVCKGPLEFDDIEEEYFSFLEESK